MIRICFTHNRVTVHGHAGYAPKGEDIVCAAVSALIYTLVAYLNRTENTAEVVIRPGYVTAAAMEQSPALAVVRCGLEQVAANYPRCVEISDSE